MSSGWSIKDIFSSGKKAPPTEATEEARSTAEALISSTAANKKKPYAEADKKLKQEHLPLWVKDDGAIASLLSSGNGDLLQKLNKAIGGRPMVFNDDDAVAASNLSKLDDVCEDGTPGTGLYKQVNNGKYMMSTALFLVVSWFNVCFVDTSRSASFSIVAHTCTPLSLHILQTMKEAVNIYETVFGMKLSHPEHFKDFLKYGKFATNTELFGMVVLPIVIPAMVQSEYSGFEDTTALFLATEFLHEIGAKLKSGTLSVEKLPGKPMHGHAVLPHYARLPVAAAPGSAVTPASTGHPQQLFGSDTPAQLINGGKQLTPTTANAIQKLENQMTSQRLEQDRKNEEQDRKNEHTEAMLLNLGVTNKNLSGSNLNMSGTNLELAKTVNKKEEQNEKLQKENDELKAKLAAAQAQVRQHQQQLLPASLGLSL